MTEQVSQPTLGLLRRILEGMEPTHVSTLSERTRFWKDRLFDFAFPPKVIEIAISYEFQWGDIISDLFLGKFGPQNQHFSNALPPYFCDQTLKRLLALALHEGRHQALINQLDEALKRERVKVEWSETRGENPDKQAASRPKEPEGSTRLPEVAKGLEKNSSEWDFFISHASEDKDAIARPLAEALRTKGKRVWYDDFSLKVGDSLRESIDHGLARSSFGIVILSPHFFEKHWPKKELDGLAAREVNATKIILPVWHKVAFNEVRQYSPTLADRVAVSTERGLAYVVEKLMEAVGPRKRAALSDTTSKMQLGIEVGQPKHPRISTAQTKQTQISGKTGWPTATQQKILREVVSNFLEKKEPTSRIPFIKKGTDPDIIDALSPVILRNPTGEKLFPTALAFQFCGDVEAPAIAKSSVELIIRTFQELFRSEQEKLNFTIAEIEEQAREFSCLTNPQLGLLERDVIQLGLYLIQDFRWVHAGLGGVYPHITHAVINERIGSKDAATAWEEHIQQYRSYLDSQREATTLQQPTKSFVAAEFEQGRFEKLGEEDGNADRKFARLAIEEARKSISESDGRVHPKVGAVVVKNGVELSKAHRGERVENHAEYIALEKKLANEALAGATVYTTLEPCTTRNHPKIPCAQRLIERRVARVVMGMLDPDKRITGRGQRKLRDAGIATDFFPSDLMSEVEELNREFTRHFEQKGEEDSGGPDLSLEWKHAKNSGDFICLRNIGNASAFNIGLKFSWEELFFDPPFDKNVLHPNQEITQPAHFGERTGPHSVNLGWMEEVLRIAYLNDRKPPLEVVLSFSDGRLRFEKPFTFELGPGGQNAERIKITPRLRKRI